MDAVLGNMSGVTGNSGRDRVVRSNAMAIAETLGYRLDDVATWNGGAKKVRCRLLGVGALVFFRLRPSLSNTNVRYVSL